MSETVTPDAGEALRIWLRSVPAVTAVTGTRVATTLTGPQPAIRYALIDGSNVGGGAATVRYQVECWGAGAGAPDDGTTDMLARTIVSATPDFGGAIAGVWVAGAAARYPYRSDDAQTHRPRTIVEIAYAVAP